MFVSQCVCLFHGRVIVGLCEREPLQSILQSLNLLVRLQLAGVLIQPALQHVNTPYKDLLPPLLSPGNVESTQSGLRFDTALESYDNLANGLVGRHVAKAMFFNTFLASSMLCVSHTNAISAEFGVDAVGLRPSRILYSCLETSDLASVLNLIRVVMPVDRRVGRPSVLTIGPVDFMMVGIVCMNYNLWEDIRSKVEMCRQSNNRIGTCQDFIAIPKQWCYRVLP